MTDTQAVAGTDAEAKPQTEDKGAQDPSIDELLEQFKATETPTEQPKPDFKVDDLKDVVSYVRDEREKGINEQTNKDVTEAAKVVKGDLDIDVGLVEELLHGKAGKDPRFLRAFQTRHENPSGWKGVLQGMGKELASKLGPKIDQGLTDDRAAVEHAVHSANTGSSAEPPPDFNSMSDADFNQWQRQNIK